MAIWKQAATAAQMNALSRNTIGEHIGIEITEIGDDYVRGRMPVDRRTLQPYGLLHGGASVVLAETLGSIGAGLAAGNEVAVVGIEINANHLRAKRDGVVTATATPLHVGRRTQVWDVRIADEEGRLVCASRCTLAVVPKPPSGR